MQVITGLFPYVADMEQNTKQQLWRCHPGRMVGRLLPFGMAALVVIDWRLGNEAEYYNAAAYLAAMADLVRGNGLDDAPSFLVGQDRLGIPLATAIGAVLFALVPAAVLSALVYPTSWLMRTKGQIECS